MHVLDFIIRGKHGHKVSFDKLPAEQATSTQQPEQQQAACNSSSSSSKAPEPATTTAAVAPNSSSSHAGDSLKLKKELKKLLKRAAVSFRDLNISVHDASSGSLAQLHDTHGFSTAPHTTGASVLTAGRQRVEVEQKKLAIIMVGLPGRGKTFVCNKLKCYLNWLGHPTVHFNVGQYRRKIKEEDSIQDAAFFDHNNPVGLAERERAFQLALVDMMKYLLSDAGQVAIFDATNSTQDRRDKLSAALRGSGCRFIFIENICNDPEILQQNYVNKMMYSPDYKGIGTEKAVADFMLRIAKYEEIYEPIIDRTMHYIKLTDMVTGRGHIDINRISGYLSGKIVFYLMQVCKSGMTNARKIWLTRHGESVYNQKALIGGDSPLSENGQTYAELLPDVILSRLPKGPDGSPVPVSVWTSTLQRTINTAAGLPFAKLKWKALDEIDAGICDGLTYAQIAEKYPAEFEARKKDKLRYRYPRGESYLDLVQRLEPVISEMEREGESIVIVSHQAVLRVIFGYLMAQPQQDIPSISIPLHTVIELTPRPDGTMGVEYIPVPVHLSDAANLATSMDALPAQAAAAVAAAAAAGSGNGGRGGSSSSGGSTGPISPITPAAIGLDPAAVAAVGACPFKQGEQQGAAADVAAAAVGSSQQQLLSHQLSAGAGAAAAIDASIIIADNGENSSSSTATNGSCGQLQQHEQQQADLKDMSSFACCQEYIEELDEVTELPRLHRDEIQRMSSCSSNSSLAFMAAGMPGAHGHADTATSGSSSDAAAAMKVQQAQALGATTL